jgi:hypothetical protein
MFVAGVLESLLVWPAICASWRHPPLSPAFSLAVIFMRRAAFEMFPEERMLFEVPLSLQVDA